MRVVIVEDEPAIARRLERMTREILGSRLGELTVEHRFDDARRTLAARRPDLLILDLNLGGQDGFRLLEEGMARAEHTVVVSAHTDQALRAFDLGVTDFLGKPFGRERLARALERSLEARSEDEPSRTLAIRRPGGIDLVAIADLVYAKGSGSYAQLVLRDGSTELFHDTLDGLTRRLPETFARTHRSYVVRLDAVKSLLALEGSRYELVLHDGTRLPVGRSRVAEVRGRLEQA